MVAKYVFFNTEMERYFRYLKKEMDGFIGE